MVCRSSTPISADLATTTEEDAVLTHPMLDQLGQLGLFRHGSGVCRARSLILDDWGLEPLDAGGPARHIRRPVGASTGAQGEPPEGPAVSSSGQAWRC